MSTGIIVGDTVTFEFGNHASLVKVRVLRLPKPRDQVWWIRDSRDKLTYIKDYETVTKE